MDKIKVLEKFKVEELRIALELNRDCLEGAYSEDIIGQKYAIILTKEGKISITGAMDLDCETWGCFKGNEIEIGRIVISNNNVEMEKVINQVVSNVEKLKDC